MDAEFAAAVPQLHHGTRGQVIGIAARKRRRQVEIMALSKKTERDNIRLAILLGLVALGILAAFVWKTMS
jgi:hypothetical protein